MPNIVGKCTLFVGIGKIAARRLRRQTEDRELPGDELG
jgi:hypothetical protein